MIRELRANIVRKAIWAAAKPTQADLYTAERVMRWLSDHAAYFPEEYGDEESSLLSVAANACHVYAEGLRTT